MGIYPSLREFWKEKIGGGKKTGWTMLLSGICAGVPAYTFACPFFIVKNRMQAQPELKTPFITLSTHIRSLSSNQLFTGGRVLILRGSLLTGGQLWGNKSNSILI